MSDSLPSPPTRKRDRDEGIRVNAEEEDTDAEAKKMMKHTIEENDDDCEGYDYDANDAEAEACAPALDSGPKFHVDERVLVIDTQQMSGPQAADGKAPNLYESVVRKSGLRMVDPASRRILPERKKRGGRGGRGHHHHHHQDDVADGVREWCHLVHFQGWNARHDKWMTETDVFRDTPENRKRVLASVGKVARSPAKPKDDGSKRKKNKKRGRTGEAEEDGNGGSIYRANLRLISKACALPFTLQTILVDDRDKITKRIYPPPSFNSNDCSTANEKRGITMLHVLPAATNIISVMKQYVKDKKRDDVEEFAREKERRREEEEKQSDQKAQRQDAADGRGSACNDDGNSASASAGQDSNHRVAPSTDENPNKEHQQSSSLTTPTISSKAMLKLKKKSRRQFALSIVTLVDISLPLFLLYNEERDQFEKYVTSEYVDGGAKISSVASDGAEKEDADANSVQDQNTAIKRPSESYGAEHLLRLFIKLPFILSQYEPTDNSTARGTLDGDDDEGPAEEDKYILSSQEESRKFAEHLSELIVFLQKHLECFKGKYFAVKKKMQ